MSSSLSLQEAAQIADKSVQTIRRAIKAKKILAKRKKTPQGFIYLIDKESFMEHFGVEEGQMQSVEAEVGEIRSTMSTSTALAPEAAKTLGNIEKQYGEMKDLFTNFNKTMQTLIEHNNQERENFYRLMKTFQDRVVMLEDSVRVLHEKSNKKWFKIW